MPFKSMFQGSAVSQPALEPMQIDAAPEENDNSVEEPVTEVMTACIDLDSYIASYKGLGQLYRLMFIAERCPPLRVEALKMAIELVQSTFNVTMYQTLHRQLQEALASGQSLPDVTGQGGGSAGALPLLDQQWVESQTKRAALKLEKLDNDLKNYKSNSIKESIRRGHDDLGDHYLDCGDLSNALKCYSRARDYCTSGKHMIHVCLNVIKVSAHMQQWGHVSSYVTKAESTHDENESAPWRESVQTKLHLAAGLLRLRHGAFELAAKSFLKCSFDHCDLPELISPSNVAVYGGLCALATYSRAQLKTDVIGSASFKLFLELEPQLRDALHRFHESSYADCLRMLDEMRDTLLLDLHLSRYVRQLYAMIRNRGLVQYFSPYASADLRKMAAAFNTTVPELENELMGLILDGQIQARIDSHNKILYAKSVDQRSQTFERSLAVGKEYIKQTRGLILRAAIQASQIAVRLPRREDIQPMDASQDGTE
ncbi:COP9 signalosome complex subunit 1-like [Amphibalanus amphitrite]|uniref:COP9 signalosome complex subunit 1-like n=1 Tax=Amphibalanus amphitrite TaxID=1232801 RepID=UPI001C922438|nr:COP9 signalosome complex subunit 1-like [Amphibalanus amphitrite]XP_043215302.1 COP9 signalosome complex subunit 1-like [Amphibalanus amphitrite]XP_043215313.1 COP9 signalosome complex subunit 1-like [Amphibalanus amphitrite]